MTVTDERAKDFEDISQQQDRGILKKVVRPGNSEFKPCHKDTVYVHYVGTYFGGDEDGKQFDSSRDRNEEFSFKLGVGDVIRAWDECVATMKWGEVCELIAAPKYAYDDGKAMKFEIELFRSVGEDVSEEKDGSARKSIVEAGQSVSTPFYGVEATFQYSTFTDGKTDEPKEVTYMVGDPECSQVPKAIDDAIRHMTFKERARVTGGDKMYDVTLMSFDRIKRLASLKEFGAQINYAQSIKKRANAHMANQKYKLAVHIYKRLLDELQYLVTDGIEEQRRIMETQGNVYNNLSLAYVKLKETDKAIEMCDKVLQMDETNEKGLFRKGQAYIIAGDQEEALKYFKKCAEKYPENQAAKAEAAKCEQKVHAMKSAERARFRGVFNKFRETGLGVEEKEPEPHSEDEVSNDADGEESED